MRKLLILSGDISVLDTPTFLWPETGEEIEVEIEAKRLL